MISTPAADFVASGNAGDVLRFAWHIDAERLREVNSALGIMGGELHARGFLAHWIEAWLRIPGESRPSLQVLGSLPEDLAFLPGPGLVFAGSPAGDRWMCWYSVSADTPDNDSLLSDSSATLLFSVEGVPSAVARQFRGSLRRLRFTKSGSHEGLVFYRRI